MPKLFTNIIFIFYIYLSASASANNSIVHEPTRIETDSENSQINFYIDDRLMAVLKDDGLHVRDGVNYGGMLTDYGKAHFDASFANDPSSDIIEGGSDE